jgi:hypothetical protein
MVLELEKEQKRESGRERDREHKEDKIIVLG